MKIRTHYTRHAKFGLVLLMIARLRVNACLFVFCFFSFNIKAVFTITLMFDFCMANTSIQRRLTIVQDVMSVITRSFSCTTMYGYTNVAVNVLPWGGGCDHIWVRISVMTLYNFLTSSAIEHIYIYIHSLLHRRTTSF